MTLGPPVIGFYDANALPSLTAISTLPLVGTGFNNAIIVGQTSTMYLMRVYNNYSASAPVSDAINSVLSSYDDTTHYGSQATIPVSQAWMQVLIQDYNGTPYTDTWHAIGGTQKYAIGANGGTLPGSTSNQTVAYTSFYTVQVVTVVPATAALSTVSQGLWFEYSSV